MNSLPQHYRALVIGPGAIGGAMAAQLRADGRCAQVMELGRASAPCLDFADPSSVPRAAQALQAQAPWHLLVVATGMLHGPSGRPEKRLADLHPEHLSASFAINAIGPALVLAHFGALLAVRERSLCAVLSARVGSIGDNRLGGWYSYRASKAALNMLVKTAAIELARTRPHSVLVALHPGTVASNLSAPFGGARTGRAPQQAAARMLETLNALRPADSGSFRAYDGQVLPW